MGKPRLAKPVHVSLEISLPFNVAFMWEVSRNKKESRISHSATPHLLLGSRGAELVLGARWARSCSRPG